MNEGRHEFSISATWTGDSSGDGITRSTGGEQAFGMPAQFGGAPGRTNPEELLLAALASCYAITLALLAERRRLPAPRIEVAATVSVVRMPDRTLKLETVALAPRIVVTGGDPSQRDAYVEIAHRAERYCLISNAIQGNVAISLTPEVAFE